VVISVLAGKLDAAVFEAVPFGVRTARASSRKRRRALAGPRHRYSVRRLVVGLRRDVVAVEDLSDLALGNDARKLGGSGPLATVSVAATRECKERLTIRSPATTLRLLYRGVDVRLVLEALDREQLASRSWVQSLPIPKSSWNLKRTSQGLRWSASRRSGTSARAAERRGGESFCKRYGRTSWTARLTELGSLVPAEKAASPATRKLGEPQPRAAFSATPRPSARAAERPTARRSLCGSGDAPAPFWRHVRNALAERHP
jgi:hypothetical protein